LVETRDEICRRSSLIDGGRTRTDGPEDYPAVHKVQDGYKIALLSQWGKEPEAIRIKIDPSVDMKTPPVEQVKEMTPDAYFAYAAELLKVNAPHLTVQPTLARMKRLGIEARKSFDPAKADPVIREALQSAPAAGPASMLSPEPIKSAFDPCALPPFWFR
jgi:hypothetical protein